MLSRTIVPGLGLWMAVTGSAVAAPCAGFTDVDSTQVSAEFCSSVEWLKNRGVTLGCTSATLYCPAGAVNRLQMAAFMKRLGEALEPEFVEQSSSGIDLPLNVSAIVCQTPPYVVQGYPRMATGAAMLYHRAANVKTVSAWLRYSTNGGSTWQPFSFFPTLASNPANGYTTQSPVAAPTLLAVGQSVIFGILAVESGFPTPASDAGCSITVRIDNRIGASSPYDTQRARQ